MTQFAAASDGIRLAFERGHGCRAAPVLLIHGFGSAAQQNWHNPPAGMDPSPKPASPLLAMDCRGHGLSDKPHDEAFYGHDRMAEDIGVVMDAAGLKTAPVVGYSMGSFLALRLAAAHPARVSRLASGGVGEFYLRGPRIANRGSRAMSLCRGALLTDDKSTITDMRGRMFRDFADQPGKDRLALAACMRAMSQGLAA